MPYITLAEQGVENPSDQIQRAAQGAMLQNQIRQQMQQQQQAFPLEQQQRQAQASESTAQADTIRQRLGLQMQAQQLQNQLTSTQLQYEQETNPDRKAMLKAQVDHLNGQVANLSIQGKLLEAQAGEASARGSLFSSMASKDQPGDNPYNISETAQKPDAYGNIPITRTWTDANGKVVHTEQSIMPGRGQPRVAYKTVFDPESGQMKRVPGTLQENPQTGEMEVHFPDDQEGLPTGQPQRNASTDAIVDKYFDPGTGALKTGMFSGAKTPASAADRAQLRQILSNPQLVQEYGLNAYSDLSKTLGMGSAQTTPETSPSPPGTGSTSVVRPSAVASDSGNQDDMTRSGDGGPSGAVTPPSLTAPQDTPAGGVSSLGQPVKAGNAPSPGAPTAPVRIRTGRTGAPPPGTLAPGALPSATATPQVSGKKASKFGDVGVGEYFMQNGVRYKKTGTASAEPAEADSTGAAATGQTPSLPSAQGM